MSRPQEWENSRNKIDEAAAEIDQAAAENESRRREQQAAEVYWHWKKLVGCLVVVMVGLLGYKIGQVHGARVPQPQWITSELLRSGREKDKMETAENYFDRVRKQQEVPVTRGEYERWQKQVITSFFDRNEWSTEHMPKDYAPAVVKQSKVVLMVYPQPENKNTENLLQAVKGGKMNMKNYKKGSDVMLWHLGKNKNDGVSFGWKETDDIFKYPCFDLGGLTNVKHKPGQEPVADLVDEQTFDMDDNFDENQKKKLAQDLFNRWADHWVVGSEAPNLMKNVQLFVNSVSMDGANWKKFTGYSVNAWTFQFASLPSDHRVVVTPGDVVRATGKYYVRKYGGEKSQHGQESDGENLFCAVSEKGFVTPNYNEHNIKYETKPYPQEEKKKNVPDWLWQALIVVGLLFAVFLVDYLLWLFTRPPARGPSDEEGIELQPVS